MDDAIRSQVANLELVALLKQKSSDSKSQSDVLQRCIDTVQSVPDSFSFLHVTHDIVKFLNSLIGTSDDSTVQVSRLVEILISRFPLTFRPQSRDVLRILRFGD